MIIRVKNSLFEASKGSFLQAINPGKAPFCAQIAEKKVI
jgi:hypothetical protein